MTLPLLLTLALTVPNEVETEIRSYDLGLATPSVEEQGPVVRLLPSLALPGEQLPWQPEERDRDFDTTATILYEVFESEFEYEGRWIVQPSSDRMIIQAPAAVHAEVERVLAFLERALNPSIEVELHWIDLPASGQDAVRTIAPRLTPGRAQELVRHAEAVGRHESVTVRLRPGRSTTVDLSRELALMRDYDVEIAEKSVITEPVVESVLVGTRLSLWGCARSDGARVRLALRGSELLGDVRENEIAGRSQITVDGNLLFGHLGRLLQSLDVANRSLALATFLPVGQVVALALHDARSDHGGRRWLLMSLKGTPEPSGTTLTVGNRTLQVFDLERLSASSWDEGSFFGPPYARPRPQLRMRDKYVEFGFDELGTSVGLFAPDYDSTRDLVVQGNEDWITMFGYGPWNVTASEELVDYRVYEAAAPGSDVHDLRFRLVRGDEELASVRLSTLDGEDCVAVVGTETFVVGDFEVEVAQSANGMDPRQVHVFDGLLVRAKAKRALDGDVVVDVAVRGHVLEGGIEDFDTGSSVTGTVQLPRHRNLMLYDRVVFDSQDRSFVLGDAGGTGLALEVGLN